MRVCWWGNRRERLNSPKIDRRARSVPGVLALPDLRAEYVGHDTVHAGMRVAVKAGLPVGATTRIAAVVRRTDHHGQHSSRAL